MLLGSQNHPTCNDAELWVTGLACKWKPKISTNKSAERGSWELAGGLSSICLNQGQKRRQARGLNRAEQGPKSGMDVAHNRNSLLIRVEGGGLGNTQCHQWSLNLEFKIFILQQTGSTVGLWNTTT